MKIWDVPWVADEHYPIILTPKDGSNIMDVSELIDMSCMLCKEPLIKQTFVE